MKIEDRVKQSGYSLKGKRDYWQSLGREPAKSNAKQAYQKACNERGTITAILQANKSRGISAGFEVTWDNGTVSRCLGYRIELVDNC
jgi:hypothetical protein